jgi:hypothetical protein
MQKRWKTISTGGNSKEKSSLKNAVVSKDKAVQGGSHGGGIQDL